LPEEDNIYKLYCLVSTKMTELSVFIAKIISVSYLAIGFGAFFNKDYYKNIMDDTFKNSGVRLLFGIFTMLIGFLIVNYHNFWVKDWTVLITIVGWISILKGVFLIAFPDAIQNFSRSVFKSLSKIIPYTSIAVGLIFGYFGFLA